NGGDHKSKQAPGGVDLTAAQVNGRTLFAKNCATCHTLRAVNAVGKVGPNLDQLRPPKELILNAIETGRARGNGQMPADLVAGQAPAPRRWRGLRRGGQICPERAGTCELTEQRFVLQEFSPLLRSPPFKPLSLWPNRPRPKSGGPRSWGESPRGVARALSAR